MLYALGLVKDEADVLEANIRHAAAFCDKVIYMDNGSSDDSWAIIEALASELPGRVVAYERTTDPYIEGMRCRIANDYRAELGSDGWWLKLDADEFLDQDPRRAIADASRSGKEAIRTWQVQFAFTDVDRSNWEAGLEDLTLPVQDRRHYYRVDWREVRLWRNDPDRVWTDLTVAYPPEIDRFSRHSLFNRHYQHRDPIQMQRRFDLRRGDAHFGHEQIGDWTQAIQSAARCHYHIENQRWRHNRMAFLANQLRSKARRRLRN